MLCGARSFSYDDSPRPKASKLKKSLSLDDGKKHVNTSKNPYADKGLDKFDKILAELEEKRKEILKRKGSFPGEVTVRFRYSSTEGWIPIIVKSRQSKKKEKKEIMPPAIAVEVKKLQLPTVSESKKELQVVEVSKEVISKKAKEERIVKKRLSRNISHFWAMVIVLLLLCLIFGRTFAICLATVLWYMVPIIKEKSSGNMRTENGKRLSNQRVVGSNLGIAHSCNYSSMNSKKMRFGVRELESSRFANGKRGS